MSSYCGFMMMLPVLSMKPQRKVLICCGVLPCCCGAVGLPGIMLGMAPEPVVVLCVVGGTLFTGPVPGVVVVAVPVVAGCVVVVTVLVVVVEAALLLTGGVLVPPQAV